MVDSSGNSASCNLTVNILDIIPPVAICQDITVYLDDVGEVSITAGDIDNGSNDACGIDSISIDAEDFLCADKGDTSSYLNGSRCEWKQFHLYINGNST